MKNLIYFFCIIFLISCTKERQPTLNSGIEIYLLKSFSINMNQATKPYTLVISNAVLNDTPFVKNEEIISYNQKTGTFQLKNDINPVIKNFGHDKGFAVVVNGKPIYFGRFHSNTLSSMTIGIATIAPELTTTSLNMNYIFIEGSADLKLLDKRNDPRILQALGFSRWLKY